VKISILGIQKIVSCNTKIYLDVNRGAFMVKYLGIPIHFYELKNDEWKRVGDHFKGKPASWFASFFLME
jgi:hypothetical protein